MTDFETCSSPRPTEECRNPRRVRAISYPGGCSQTFQPTLGNDLKKPNLAVAIAERSVSSSSESSGRSEDVESCCNVDVGDDNSPKSALRNFLTIVALSLHCVFEGLAIGKKSRRSRKKIKTLQKKIWRRFRQKNQDALDKKKKINFIFFFTGLEDNQDSVWILFAAVATHKFVISFCIALELYHARTPIALYSAYIIIFAIVTPIGNSLECC